MTVQRLVMVLCLVAGAVCLPAWSEGDDKAQPAALEVQEGLAKIEEALGLDGLDCVLSDWEAKVTRIGSALSWTQAVAFRDKSQRVNKGFWLPGRPVGAFLWVTNPQTGSNYRFSISFTDANFTEKKKCAPK